MAIIRLDSGINCDYITVDGDRYAFGYDVARNPGDTYKGYGKEVLPTVQEILKQYPEPYILVAGINKFNGKPVPQDAIYNFKEKYLK